MVYFNWEFKNRAETLLNESFIPLVLGITEELEYIDVEKLEAFEFEDMLTERIMYIENIIYSGWLLKMAREKMDNTFYNLSLELEEAKWLLMEYNNNLINKAV